MSTIVCTPLSSDLILSLLSTDCVCVELSSRMNSLGQMDTHADDNYQQIIRKKISSQGNEDAFFLCDLGTVLRQHEEWARLCPGVEPFYAVKCNNDPALLQG